MMPDDASEPISLSRRRFLECSLAGLGAAIISPAVSAESAVAASHRITTDDDIKRLLPQLSNWGRWGKDDQLRTLNYITPKPGFARSRSSRPGKRSRLAGKSHP